MDSLSGSSTCADLREVRSLVFWWNKIYRSKADSCKINFTFETEAAVRKNFRMLYNNCCCLKTVNTDWLMLGFKAVFNTVQTT